MSRNKILAAIRRNTQTTDNVSLPDSVRWQTHPTVSEEDFIQAVKTVGGECIDIRGQDSESIDARRVRLPTHQNNDAANLSKFDLREYFDGHEPEVLHAHFGIAENGACWIDHHPDDERTRYTLPENIAILLPADQILPTMHEAYERIKELGIDDLGIFLSGPSKTADIEQALVLGAQGAIVTKVFLV